MKGQLTLEKLREAKKILDQEPVSVAPRFLAYKGEDGRIYILRADGSVVFDENGDPLSVDEKVLSFPESQV
jgi:hypothetical protein